MNSGVSNKRLVLPAIVFAVAMTFIDQTIVAIAIPSLQKDLSLSATGSQWIINGYLLALSALFASGGKLGDVTSADRRGSRGPGQPGRRGRLTGCVASRIPR